MKRFDSDKALKKLDRKRNTSAYIKYSVFVVSILMFVVGVIYFTKAVFTSNEEFTIIDAKVGEFSSGDITIAYNVEGVNKKTITDRTDLYYLSNTCTNDVTLEVTNGDWQNATYRNLGYDGTKCTLYFAKPTIKYYLDDVEVDKETALSYYYDMESFPLCNKGASIIYNENDNTYTTSDVTETDTTCNVYFTTNEIYSVEISTVNFTSSQTQLNINYGGSNTLVITPYEGYYLSSASCSNGYSIDAITGENTTGEQVITITNNGYAGVGTCTITGASPYKYWTAGYNRYEYSSSRVPDTVYSDYRSLITSGKTQAFARTTYSNGNPSMHGSCLYYGTNDKMFCLDRK